MTAPPIDAAADLGVRTSQPEGIGRVVALDGLVCWNNLGRNVVCADALLRPQAVLATSLYDDDELSQYDLDVHAVLEISETRMVIVLNHLGTVRAFRRRTLERTGPTRAVEADVHLTFAADVERTVLAGTRLVGARPRAERAPGVLLSSPLTSALDGHELDLDVACEVLGEVTALASVAGGDDLVAVGGDASVALVPFGREGPGRLRWHRPVGFRVAVLTVEGDVLWAAGPERADDRVDDYNWDALHGGGFAALRVGDGAVLAEGRLPTDVAWGTGGVAVVPYDGVLLAVTRSGDALVIEPSEPAPQPPATATAARSLGIAHAAAVGTGVLYGFNRGRYRLWLTDGTA